MAWTIAFILYKPAAAIVYAIAFRMTGTDLFKSDGTGLFQIVTGLALMLIALVALPALMRFLVPAVASVGGAVPRACFWELRPFRPRETSRRARSVPATTAAVAAVAAIARPRTDRPAAHRHRALPHHPQVLTLPGRRRRRAAAQVRVQVREVPRPVVQEPEHQAAPGQAQQRAERAAAAGPIGAGIAVATKAAEGAKHAAQAVKAGTEEATGSNENGS